MDMDRFLTVQRCKLEEDKDRLSNKSPVPCNYFADCIPKNEKPTKNCNEIVGQHKQCNAKANIIDFQPKVNDPPVLAGVVLSPKTTQKTCTNYTMATSLSLQNQQNAQQADDFKIHDNLGRKYCETKHENNATKCAKNLANLNERQCAEADIIFNKRGNKDDMEQWVSDTFYSYFPGYNNENKKRQDILRDRQLEYQQNFLKHQMIEAAANSAKKKHPHNHPPENGERNIPDTNSKPLTSRSTDKTELEIIVNNPNYEAKSPRPGSARHKLLQDLKHTEISNIVNSDGVTERNRRNAEVEMAKKKDYQKELMAQIEEKRRTIEVLKEKERRQEEALTRKLQEQLKTMHLQEELEKERMRADKVRFDSEQNRLMREHLLTKLENDAKLLTSARKPRSENDKVTPEENKVYKYFSNSARHEFRREPVTELPAFHLDLPQSSSHRKKCFQNDNHDNICPFCDSPLKNYESWCLNCERKIFKTNETDHKNLVCEKCKKIYEVCYDCDKNNESNSIHCEKKQNFCTTCRKGMCSNCIETISVARDKTKAESERSFEILEINYPEDDEEDQPVGNDLNNNHDHSRPPYSMNIDRNSIFHHDFDRTKFYDDDNNIEMIRQETDKRLSRYLKNYGDLACKSLRDRSTQTTPDSASRRDIVMVEENNLSMPLLREMPRMTRKESNLQQDERKKKGTRIENLARRWEVPAVQKHTITTHSPKILTQLGAIRKQLQSEQLQLDY